MPCALPGLSARCFARRSRDDDDEEQGEEDDPYEDEDELRGGRSTADELHDDLERKLDRGPSKAERLRLKEKEKRRQKMAMRERQESKKEAWKTRAPKKSKLDPVEDGGDVADLDVHATVLSTTTSPEPDSAAAKAEERQRQKRLMLQQRFGRSAKAEEEEDEKDSADEDDGRLVNDAIKAPTIVLIDGAGKRIGLVATSAALKKARESHLDIITLSPAHVSPPVCRVVDYREWLQLEREKKGLTEPKRAMTVQLRKSIDPHDLQHKVAAMRRFLQAGHRVRLLYYESTWEQGEWVELFTRVAGMVEGVGVCADLESKPVVQFTPITKKQLEEIAARKKKEAKLAQQAQKAQLAVQQARPAQKSEMLSAGAPVSGAAEHVGTSLPGDTNQRASASQQAAGGE